MNKRKILLIFKKNDEEPSGEMSQEGKRILLVEDEAVFVDMFGKRRAVGVFAFNVIV